MLQFNRIVEIKKDRNEDPYAVIEVTTPPYTLSQELDGTITRIFSKPEKILVTAYQDRTNLAEKGYDIEGYYDYLTQLSPGDKFAGTIARFAIEPDTIEKDGRKVVVTERRLLILAERGDDNWVPRVRQAAKNANVVLLDPAYRSVNSVVESPVETPANAEVATSDVQDPHVVAEEDVEF